MKIPNPALSSGLLLGALFGLSGASPPPLAAKLGVAPSGRHLTLEGKPFFWLGDTVWLLAQVPSRDELELYLRTRAEQGFTVIQLTAVMGEERVWGTLRATSRGDTPFVDGDPLQPAVTPGSDPADPAQYDYWDHLDYVLERVHAHGLRAALVTWFVGWGGDGYQFLKPQNAHQYGRFLGERYRGKPEIIWVLGGDNTPKNEEQKAVWPLVAKGLAEGLTSKEDYSQVLMTYHINGGASSADLWHDSAWLDFNMAQTWDAYQNIYPALLRDYERRPAKPCGLGEGAYEDGPQYPTKPINALVIRRQACWSWFAGGYHTYGNGNVWHFDTCKPELTQTWTEALRSPGAATLHLARKFLETIGWWRYVPDDSLIAEGEGSSAQRNVAMRSVDGNAVAVYLAAPSTVKLRLDGITAGGTLTARWTNPATGEEKVVGAVDRQTDSFTSPVGWDDALLQVYAPPGRSGLGGPEASAAVSEADGIATKYPGDVGIARDSRVVFVEDFEEESLEVLWRRWETVGGREGQSFAADVPPGSLGKRSLAMDRQSGSGPQLYRRLKNPAGGYGFDRVFARYHVKFDRDCGEIHHFGTCLGGNEPPTAWPSVNAGHPADRAKSFWSGIEPFGSSWVWDYYTSEV